MHNGKYGNGVRAIYVKHSVWESCDRSTSNLVFNHGKHVGMFSNMLKRRFNRIQEVQSDVSATLAVEPLRRLTDV